MVMKIKLAFGNDCRLFKYDGASLSEAFDAVTAFVVNTFGVNEFHLQYVDEENDLITVTSENELDEAFDVAMEQGKTLKLFVVAVAAQQAAAQAQVEPAVVEEKAEIPSPEPATVTEAEEIPATDAQGGDGGKTIADLVALLVEDEGFRQEFSAFAQDVVLQLREGDNFETSVQVALATHEELASHPFVRDHFMHMLPRIAEKAAFFVPYLKNVEPTTIPGMIENVAQSMKGMQNMQGGGSNLNLMAMMPMLMGMLGGAGGPCGGAGGNPNPMMNMNPFLAAMMAGAQNANGSPDGAGSCGGAPMGPLGGLPFFGGGFGPHGGAHGPPHGHHGQHGFHGFHRGRGRGHRGRGHRGWGHQGGRCGGDRDDGSSPEYRAQIIDANVTLVDKAVVLPQSSVVKTWRIRNTGEFAFPEGTKLKYVGRPFNPLVDGVEFPVESVQPGEEGEVSVLLSTPAQGGRFGSAWRLQTPDGTPFGPMLRVRVVVATAEQPRLSSDDSDDLADIYDDEPSATVPVKKSKKDKQLEKLVAQRAKLEARLAKIGQKIDATTSAVEAKEEVEEAPRPIVSTLPTTTAGGPADADEAADDAAGEAFVFGDQLAELQSMGFSDVQLNRLLLQQHNGELEPVLNTLCELKA